MLKKVKKMENNKGCSTCKHRKDFLVPCDWVKTQNHVIVKCPRYEEENPWIRINDKFSELCKKGGNDGN